MARPELGQFRVMGMQPGPSPKNDEPRGSTPVPDPTQLTTQQLLGAIDSLKELLRAEIHASTAVVNARFDALERANQLLQEIFDRQPKIYDDKIEALRTLHAERFSSIQTQFTERDVRTEQTSRDSKVAVDAALQAAKEAVGKQQEASDRAIAKSETSTTKQLEALQELIRSNTKGTDEKVGDLKERLTRIEGANIGAKSADSSHNTSTTMLIAIAGVVIALVVGASTLLSRGTPAVASVQYVPSAVPVPVPAPR